MSLDQTAAGDLAAEGLVRLNNLNSLHLGSSQLTDVGLRKLCGILSLHNLQITRDANQVTDDGLVDLWLLVNLQNLTLNAPKITGTGLATVRELPKLRDLNLGAAGLTDAACQNVAGSEHLKQLHLGGWQGAPPALSDAGLRFLAKAEKLEQVNLFRKGTQITDEGVAELRRALPKLKLNVQGP